VVRASVAAGYERIGTARLTEIANFANDDPSAIERLLAGQCARLVARYEISAEPPMPSFLSRKRNVLSWSPSIRAARL
jgi:hypothetical protein